MTIEPLETQDKKALLTQRGSRPTKRVWGANGGVQTQDEYKDHNMICFHQDIKDIVKD